jgi:hypothetical protein
VLGQVSVDEQQQDTSVEELSNEDSVCDGSKLLRACILTDPGNSLDDNCLQHDVNGDNNESN